MNRRQMAEEIARRVPTLVKRDQDEWEKARRLREQFVADYRRDRIPKLRLDEYVIGRGAHNRSFCYRIEREMDILGRILGATSFKFGIYFGRTKEDPTEEYRFRPHWGSTRDDVFDAVKQAIVGLLSAAAKRDTRAIAENSLSPMLKGKILFLYYPDQYAPIYSEEHLKHFVAHLDLAGPFTCGADMQRALMEYRATWPELRSESPALYMRFLYDVFGYPPGKQSNGGPSPQPPLLDDAICGATFIHSMPAGRPGTSAPAPSRGKIDHEARQRALKRIGNRGEALVIALEKQRLTAARKTKLAAKIDHVADRDDSIGYDILSYEEDGSERPIEVKATSAADLGLGFYVTANELAQAEALPNYHIYFVFNAMTKSPKVLPVKKPNLKGSAFLLRAVNYIVIPTEKKQ
jgi:hypothetical protein